MAGHLQQMETQRKLTEAWVAEHEPVGRAEGDFRLAAEAAGFEVGVVERDGQRFPVRAKRDPRRIQVSVADGLITEVLRIS